MYCPKCAAPLEDDPGGFLRCSSGQLEFSLDLSRKLRAAYGAAPALDAAIPTEQNFRVSLEKFFCPRCAGTLPSDGACLSCGMSLRPFIYVLIEHHPHGDGRGGFF